MKAAILEQRIEEVKRLYAGTPFELTDEEAAEFIAEMDLPAAEQEWEPLPRPPALVGQSFIPIKPVVVGDDPKPCTKCKGPRPLGRKHPWCYWCLRIVQKASREKKIEHYRKKNREWNEAHPEQMQTYADRRKYGVQEGDNHAIHGTR